MNIYLVLIEEEGFGYKVEGAFSTKEKAGKFKGMEIKEGTPPQSIKIECYTVDYLL